MMMLRQQAIAQYIFSIVLITTSVYTDCRYKFNVVQGFTINYNNNYNHHSHFEVKGFVLQTSSSSSSSSSSSTLLSATKEDSIVSSTSSMIDGLTSEQQQILIKKANEFPNSSFTGWSNRAGKVLTPISIPNNNEQSNNNVYSADRQFTWFGIDVGGRCTIIELPNNDNNSNNKPDLFIHSPVELDNELRTTLETIGTIKYVMSPNYEHLKYYKQWYDTYNKDKDNNNNEVVQCWGCPGLSSKKTNINWAGEIPYNYRPISWQYSNDNDNAKIITEIKGYNDNQCWDTSILQPLHINIEKNPFTGQPFFEEVLFYHVPTKSLLTTDFFWNYPHPNGITNYQQGYIGSWTLAPSIVIPSSNDNEQQSLPLIPKTSQVWKWAMDNIYDTFFHNFMISNIDEYNKICHHLLNVWDIEIIIPCHGDIIRGKSNVQKALRNALRMKQ